MPNGRIVRLEPRSRRLGRTAAAMRAGAVETLLILDSNPAYNAPGDLQFAEALHHVAHVVHLGLYRDETGILAEWHLPMTHSLEAWSDARAYDGTAGIAQPLLAPLYAGRSAHEVLAMLLGDDVREGRALVRRQWQERLPDERSWSNALQSGMIVDTRTASQAVAVSAEFLAGRRARYRPRPERDLPRIVDSPGSDDR